MASACGRTTPTGSAAVDDDTVTGSAAVKNNDDDMPDDDGMPALPEPDHDFDVAHELVVDFFELRLELGLALVRRFREHSEVFL